MPATSGADDGSGTSGNPGSARPSTATDTDTGPGRGRGGGDPERNGESRRVDNIATGQPPTLPPLVLSPSAGVISSLASPTSSPTVSSPTVVSPTATSPTTPSTRRPRPRRPVRCYSTEAIREPLMSAMEMPPLREADEGAAQSSQSVPGETSVLSDTARTSSPPALAAASTSSPPPPPDANPNPPNPNPNPPTHAPSSPRARSHTVGNPGAWRTVYDHLSAAERGELNPNPVVPTRNTSQRRPRASSESYPHSFHSSSSHDSNFHYAADVCFPEHRRKRHSLDANVPPTDDRADRYDPTVADYDGRLLDDVVGLLDCVDPEVGTVNHLQNMTNSLVVPYFPALWTRRPKVVLPSDDEFEEEIRDYAAGEDASSPLVAGTGTGADGRHPRTRSSTMSSVFRRERPPMTHLDTIASVTEPQEEPADSVPLSALPRVDRKEGQTRIESAYPSDDKAPPSETETEMDEADEIEREHELDKHLKRVLKRKQMKEKIKPMLRGLWAFVKTPMGFIVAIYGFLVVFWGAALVLFLLGWIPTNSKNTKNVWVEICSQIVNGLFTVTGVGLIPWRAMDTYRMSVIWTLRVKTQKLRKKRGLPPIEDPDDLPDPAEIPGYTPVLTEKEQAKLQHQQEMFAKSQTWYRPHATATHRAFPIKWALWNTILMDGNSFFQCLLCGCMWGMNRHQRPAWTTGSLIPLSFLCGIGAAVLAWRGGVKTKKTAAVQEKLRAALGVDEKVAPEVKKPRRATVTGAERPSAAAQGLPNGTAPESPSSQGGALVSGGGRPRPTKPPHRRATVDVLPGVSEGSERSESPETPLVPLTRDPQLGRFLTVTEADEDEDASVASSPNPAKDSVRDADANGNGNGNWR